VLHSIGDAIFQPPSIVRGDLGHRDYRKNKKADAHPAKGRPDGSQKKVKEKFHKVDYWAFLIYHILCQEGKAAIFRPVSKV
jgi:hypothetical protein